MEAGRVDREPQRLPDPGGVCGWTRAVKTHGRREERLLVAGGLAHLADVHRRRIDLEDDMRVGAEILDHLHLDVDLRQ